MASKKKKKQLRARKCASMGCQRITMHDRCERCRISAADVARLIGVPPEMPRR